MLMRVTMASPPSNDGMPYRTNLDLFGPVALAYLMEGPKPQTTLDDGHVPISVLEQSEDCRHDQAEDAAAWQSGNGMVVHGRPGATDLSR
jgi:hypothetical protein